MIEPIYAPELIINGHTLTPAKNYDKHTRIYECDGERVSITIKVDPSCSDEMVEMAFAVRAKGWVETLS
jgi:hypothetical protein